MEPTIEQAKGIVRMARMNPMMLQFESIYRMLDAEDGALCFALMVVQGMPGMLATSATTDVLVAAIEDAWTADGWVKP